MVKSASLLPTAMTIKIHTHDRYLKNWNIEYKKLTPKRPVATAASGCEGVYR
jgi:hypothetical protein